MLIYCSVLSDLARLLMEIIPRARAGLWSSLPRLMPASMVVTISARGSARLPASVDLSRLGVVLSFRVTGIGSASVPGGYVEGTGGVLVNVILTRVKGLNRF